MPQLTKLLKGLLLFNTITALAGGLALMFGLTSPLAKWLPSILSHSYLLPGFVLAFGVGGSAALGLFSLVRMTPRAYEISKYSGYVMIAWIIGEIVVIRQLNWLQALYLLTGAMVVVMASRFVALKSARGT